MTNLWGLWFFIFIPAALSGLILGCSVVSLALGRRKSRLASFREPGPERKNAANSDKSLDFFAA